MQSDQVEVRTGDMVQGGEMLEGEDGREISFEYIANLQRLFDRNGQVWKNGQWNDMKGLKGDLCGGSAQILVFFRPICGDEATSLIGNENYGDIRWR